MLASHLLLRFVLDLTLLLSIVYLLIELCQLWYIEFSDGRWVLMRLLTLLCLLGFMLFLVLFD